LKPTLFLLADTKAFHDSSNWRTKNKMCLKRFVLNPVLDIETMQWVSNDGVTYEEPRILFFGGPSQASKDNEAAQTAFYKQMTAEQATTYAEQQDLLANVKEATLPTLAGGVNQFGFSPEEDALFQSLINTGAATQEADISQQAAIQQASTAAQGQILQSQIQDQGSQQAENVINATELSELQKSGGVALPSGSNTQVEETARDVGAQQTATNLSAEELQQQQQTYSTQMTAAQETAAVEQARQQQLLQEKISGYSAGSANYSNALNSLTGQAQIINPISTAQATTGAGTAATGSVNLVDSENSNLLSSILGGVTGGAIKAGTSFLTGGLTNLTQGNGFLNG
jgi:hypothetical protein